MTSKPPKDDYGQVQWNMGALFQMVENIRDTVNTMASERAQEKEALARDYATKFELASVIQISTATRELLSKELTPIQEHVKKASTVLGIGSRMSRMVTGIGNIIFTSTITLLVAYYFNKYFS